MDPYTLRQLLTQPESPTLEFKQEMYKLDSPDGNTKRRQGNELIKDILSLANGNANVAGETAYLIIGAENHFRADGTRQLYDITVQAPQAEDLLKRVNAACTPALDDLLCEHIEIDGKRLVVITIPPSRHLHETLGTLVAETIYSPHIVFTRRVDSVEVANGSERLAIQRMKQFHFEQTLRVPPRLISAVSGAVSGGLVPEALIRLNMPTATITPAFRIGGAVFGGLIGLLIGQAWRSALRILFHLRTWPDRARYGLVAAVMVFSGSLPYLARYIQRILRHRS
jgi:hypothetical protein